MDRTVSAKPKCAIHKKGINAAMQHATSFEKEFNAATQSFVFIARPGRIDNSYSID